MFGFRKKSEGAKSPPSPAPAEDPSAATTTPSSAADAPAASEAPPAAPETPAPAGGRSWFGFRRSSEPAAETPTDAVGVEAAPEAAPPEQKSSWFSRLRSGLKKTGASLGAIFVPRRIDEALFEELETALLSADAGLEATEHLLKGLRQRVKRDRLETSDQLKAALAEELTTLLKPLEVPLDPTLAKPFVMMIAGVNGAGKTTSIGKLAKFFREQNLTVLLAAGDTFRAAAREQLAAWGERNGVTVISQDNADPAAVIFDAVGAARARGIDVVIADTAGRLPTQLHLMEELRKVKRVIGKAQADAPHEVMIVLDANNGQNALKQVEAFDGALGVTGIVLTKLDGTAKGGVVAAIALARSKQPGRGPIPLRFVGVGEGLDDLRPFVAADFARALLD